MLWTVKPLSLQIISYLRATFFTSPRIAKIVLEMIDSLAFLLVSVIFAT